MRFAEGPLGFRGSGLSSGVEGFGSLEFTLLGQDSKLRFGLGGASALLFGSGFPWAVGLARALAALAGAPAGFRRAKDEDIWDQSCAPPSVSCTRAAFAATQVEQ